MNCYQHAKCFNKYWFYVASYSIDIHRWLNYTPALLVNGVKIQTSSFSRQQKINSMKMTLSLSFAIGIVQLHSENSIWHFGWLHLKTVVIYISIYNQPNHCLHIIWNHIILLTIWISATGEERNFIAFFGFYQGGFMKYSGFSLILVRLCVISVRSSIPG